MRFITRMLFVAGVACLSLVVVPSSSGQDEEGVTVEYSAADKAAVEKIRESGGAVLEVAQNDNRLNVAFHLSTEEIGNDQLALVKDLGFIVSLNMRGTAVDDKGVANLGGCSGLQRLHLEKTKVTDAAIKHLAPLSGLEYLNIYGTAVTDVAIDDIAALKGLKKVFIWETKITIDGVAKLKEKRPDLQIIPDLVVEKVKAAAEVKRKAEEEAMKAIEAKKKAEEEAKKKAEEEAKKKAEAAAKKAAEEAAAKKAAEAAAKKAAEAAEAAAAKKAAEEKKSE
jgi:hypothetical protein